MSNIKKIVLQSNTGDKSYAFPYSHTEIIYCSDGTMLSDKLATMATKDWVNEQLTPSESSDSNPGFMRRNASNIHPNGPGNIYASTGKLNATSNEQIGDNSFMLATKLGETNESDAWRSVTFSALWNWIKGKIDSDNYTTNTGTVESVSVKMNGAVKGTVTTTGTIDLGTVITSHQDISGKVDKVSGKGLSANDFTTALKTKLEGIASGAEVNVQSDWNVTDTTSDAYIKNKPTIPSVGYTANGKNYPVLLSDNKMYVNVPWTDNNTEYSAATSSALGLVKLGSDTEQSVEANAVTATASRTYAVQKNSSGQMVVNVPWVNNDTHDTTWGISGSAGRRDKYQVFLEFTHTPSQYHNYAVAILVLGTHNSMKCSGVFYLYGMDEDSTSIGSPGVIWYGTEKRPTIKAYKRDGTHYDLAVYYGNDYCSYSFRILQVSGTTITTRNCIREYATTVTAAATMTSPAYLPLAGGTMTGSLIINKTTDASGTANNSPALIVGGAATGTHLELDANEIMAKASGTTVADLYVNNDGGYARFGGGVSTKKNIQMISPSAILSQSTDGLIVWNNGHLSSDTTEYGRMGVNTNGSLIFCSTRGGSSSVICFYPNVTNGTVPNDGIKINSSGIFSGTDKKYSNGLSSYQWSDTRTVKATISNKVQLQYNASNYSLDFVFI